MSLLCQLGLLLFTLLVIPGKPLNDDDNRTIEKPLAVSGSILAPAFTQIPSHADVSRGLLLDGNISEDDISREISATKPTGGKEQQIDQEKSTIRNTVNVNDNTAKVHGLEKTDTEGTTMTVEEGVTEIIIDSASEINETQKPRIQSKPDKDATVTDNPAESVEVKNTEKQANDKDKEEKITKSGPGAFVLPDPIENYSNNLMLDGHVFGINNDVLSMIHAALSSGNIFVPVEPLMVHPVSNSFEEIGYEGDKVTSITYVVSYNGKPVHKEIITRLMSTPKVSHHFGKQLEGRRLRQYKQAQPVQNKSWAQQHLAAVTIPSCVAFVLIILFVVFIVARKRSAGASKLEKKRPSTSDTKGGKKCPPSPYSVENPAYDFETNAVMDGYTLP